MRRRVRKVQDGEGLGIEGVGEGTIVGVEIGGVATVGGEMGGGATVEIGKRVGVGREIEEEVDVRFCVYLKLL